MRGHIIPLTIVALFVLGTLASAAPATHAGMSSGAKATWWSTSFDVKLNGVRCNKAKNR